MAGIMDLILQKIQTPQPALAPSAIDEEALARTAGLNSLVSDAQSSAVPVQEPRLADSIIRAIAGAVSVGTSTNPSEALARQLIQQQADQERRRQIQQQAKEREFAAKTTVAKARVEAGEQIRKELQEDKKLIATRQAEEAELEKRQSFERELVEFKGQQDAKAATLSADRAQALERLRQKDNITSTHSLNSTKLIDDGVDAKFIPGISDAILNQKPFTPEQQAAIDEARRRRDALKLASASMRTSANEKLTLPRIASLHKAFVEMERAKKVPAVYEDPAQNPNTLFPAIANNAMKQPGMPVTQGLFRTPVLTNIDEKTATQRGFEYAQSLALASEDPEVMRKTQAFLGGPQIDLSSLGPLAAKAERVLTLVKSSNLTHDARDRAIDAMKTASPDEKAKLKAFFKNLP